MMMSRRKLFGWLVAAPAATVAISGRALASGGIISLPDGRSLQVINHAPECIFSHEQYTRLQEMIDASAQETRLKIQKDFGAMAQSYRVRHG
jgi:hypothetical protein